MRFHRCSKSSGLITGRQTSFRSFALVLALFLIGIHTFGEVFHSRLHGGWAAAIDAPAAKSPGTAYDAPGATPASLHDDCGFCTLNGLVGILCGASVALTLALVAVAAARANRQYHALRRIPARLPTRAPPLAV